MYVIPAQCAELGKLPVATGRASQTTKMSRTQRKRKVKIPVCYSEKDSGVDYSDQLKYRIADKLSSSQYSLSGCSAEMTSSEAWSEITSGSFSRPILVRDRAGLGLSVPNSKNFSPHQVRDLIGADRLIDVVDVETQAAEHMTLGEFARYWRQKKRTRLLNVLSLEFSHTPLSDLVTAPSAVRAVDWVDSVWPARLKRQQTDGSNALRTMKYPKIQKYCLMSVAGCYTDFHVDMAGSSVWYHVLRGCKHFWFIPPTELNLGIFEEWTRSTRQSSIFLADEVADCEVIQVNEGETLFLPSGWIHAVYTERDSLVFGGNFLHTAALEMQLKIADLEARTHVPDKFRLPFFNEMMWFAAWRISHGLQVSCEHGYCKRESSENIGKHVESLKLLVSWLSTKHSSIPATIADRQTDPTLLLSGLAKVLDGVTEML